MPKPRIFAALTIERPYILLYDILYIKMTEKGKNLIKQFEGCSLVAYKCPAGVWTIGYGNTRYGDGSPVKEGDKIDSATANQLFDFIIADYEKQVRLILGQTLCTTLPAEAIDALISFSYNCGTAAFAKSTLLKKIKSNKNDLIGIEAEFNKWNKGSGKVLQGLVKRRQAEANMYINAVLSHYTHMEIYKNFIKK